MKKEIQVTLIMISVLWNDNHSLLVGGIKNRLKISVFYGEKVVHLADI